MQDHRCGTTGPQVGEMGGRSAPKLDAPGLRSYTVRGRFRPVLLGFGPVPGGAPCFGVVGAMSPPREVPVPKLG